MKIQAKAQRIRRYVKRSKQFSQNQMFANDRKKFFRNLGKDQISVEKPPKKEATETFWRNILENDREHNHSAEWIKREEQKYADTECQPWEDISQDELQTVLKKASNWKSPSPDAVPNFWLKQLTALHQHLLNAYNQAIEHPENLPDWFTTAQTYLLPKNKDTENLKNYRPIACLSTSCKVLISILTERSYTHITKNDILPEEQRALVPLTSELATSGYGYKILNTSAPISNLFYMDDLKLYSKNEQEQVGELKIVKQFSDDIGMEFGLEKCAKASFMKGKLASTGNIVIDDDTEIQELNQEGVYKYLGVDESDGIQHSKMKEKIRKEYNRRVRLILRTELNGRNKIEAINSLAVPVVQYSFGIIDWKISELKKIDTKTRKLLNMHKMLHPKADVERLYIPRKDGGRGPD
ncbi:uncharacterized protein [Porites lutea]|uniref:uncharacterized protein n=1 Tax=Porites lutea TaxID=51062 RepID=UPI003CC5B8B4